MMLRSQGTASRAVNAKNPASDKENLNSKPTRGHDRPRGVLSTINIDVQKNIISNEYNLRSVKTQVKLIEPKPAHVPAYQPLTRKTIRAPVELIVDTKKPIRAPVQPVVGAKQPTQVPVQPIVGAKKLIQVPVQPTVRAKNTRSFLASLYFQVPAEYCDPVALAFRTDYKKKKEELAGYLFKYYNEEVFGGKLPYNVTIQWEPKFLKVAGLCHYRYLFDKTTRVWVKSARIRLSTKLLDTAYKLQQTLIHEMCDAAVWIIDNVSREEFKDAYGPMWRKWTNLAIKRFPELPPITQYHSYQMKTKFTYKCLACGHCIERHSKSLDIETKRCDRCNGQLELLLNRTTRSGRLRSPNPIKDKPLTGFALYVKENFHKVSKDHGDIKPTEAMKLLAEQFSKLQTGK